MIKLNKKAFTLIELLSVILILGIIALIAIPTVNNIIKESNKGAFKSSVQNIIQVVEQQCQIERLKGSEVTKIYIFYNGEVTPNIDIKGGLPSTGTLKIDDECNVSFDNIADGTYSAVKEESNDVIELNEKTGNYLTYAKGTAIYFNPVDGKKCSMKDANSQTGTNTGCMKWYILNDSENSATVDMILNHNTSTGVWWNSTGAINAPKEVQEALQDDTSTWEAGLNPRIISATEVANIVGNSNFVYNSFEDSNESAFPLQYAWLFDNTFQCKENGCYSEDNSNEYSCTQCGIATGITNLGYWTNTAFQGIAPFRSVSESWAWFISSSGLSYAVSTNIISEMGIRPVITVEKSSI